MKSTTAACKIQAISSPTNSDVGSTGIEVPRLAFHEATTSPATHISSGSHHPVLNIWESNSEVGVAYGGYDDKIRLFPRYGVFNRLSAITISANYSESTRSLADKLFQTIRKQNSFKAKYVADKREYWRQLLDAITRAVWANGCIRIPRGSGDVSLKLLQIVECAVDAGFLHPQLSPPGSPNESRYIPLSSIRRLVSFNPREFAVQTEKFVTLFSRETPDHESLELDFDPTHPVSVEVQSKLERINAVNSGLLITCLQPDPWVRNALVVRQLCPVHIARFTDSWDLHGRLYTHSFGHQSIRRLERATIRFNDEPCVELDFGGLHPRMLYHLRGLEAPDDPYDLWPSTPKPQREIAKLVLNATINAKSFRSAIAACHNRANEWDVVAKRPKYGKSLEDARVLRRAVATTGLDFRDVQQRAVQRHQAIAADFGRDMGLTLMRHDSRIALNVLYHFAKRDVPCLGVHDSFIVPERYAAELRSMMREIYSAEMNGFEPVIKDVHGQPNVQLQKAA